MASNLACVGLAVANQGELAAVVRSVLPHAVAFGEVDGLRVVRWEDRSGARLVLGLAGGEVRDLLPSFAAPAEALLDNISLVSDDVATADVVDESGDQMTSLALELEERRLIRASPPLGTSRASVIALGVDVAVHRSAGEFEVSTRSLLDPDEDQTSAPPAEYRARGWRWPPRLAPESFLSDGIFGEPAEARATARLAGTVTRAEVLSNSETNQAFVAARLTTVGFTTTVCFPSAGDIECPQPGNIVEGSVFLVGSLGLAPQE
jgi:hypothetical protein